MLSTTVRASRRLWWAQHRRQVVIWLLAGLLAGLAACQNAPATAEPQSSIGQVIVITRPTNTPTPRPSPTPTPQPTDTPTPTPTRTPSPTPSRTPIPSPTPTSSPTPTPSRTPTPSPIPPVHCPGALPSRLAIGGRARVVNYQINVRSGPGTAWPIENRLLPGRLVTVLEGPVCDNGQLWYRVVGDPVRARDTGIMITITGWVVEESGQRYFLAPAE